MFGFRGLKKLVFDEYPYKYYMVKAQSAPQLKYICFDHLEFRIYKGEGSVNLIAYYPFARGVDSPNIPYIVAGAGINNLGDLPADLELIYKPNAGEATNIDINVKTMEDETVGLMKIEDLLLQSGDTYVSINSRTQLIEGLDALKNRTGTLYNKYLVAGDFIHPPVGNTKLISSVQYNSATFTPLYY